VERIASYAGVNSIMLKKFNFLSRTAQLERWRWSDTGLPFSAKPKMYDVVRVHKAKNLVETGPIRVYCFLITSDNFLEIENCSEKRAYVCEGSEGKELIYYRTNDI